MKYFEGKIVTVLVHKTTLDFGWDEKGQYRHAQYFTGRFEGLDENNCIWVRDEIRNVRSCFQLAHVVGILEEQEVTKDHPVVQKALERAERREQLRQQSEEMAHLPSPCQQHMAALQPEPPVTQLSIDKLGKVIKTHREKLKDEHAN